MSAEPLGFITRRLLLFPQLWQVRIIKYLVPLMMTTLVACVVLYDTVVTVQTIETRCVDEPASVVSLRAFCLSVASVVVGTL